MTRLPDWLVERAALDEVPPASRSRLDGDPELPARIAALREDSAAELAKYPAGPAVAAIEARVARTKTARRRRRMATLVGVIGTACVLFVAMRVINRDATPEQPVTIVDAGSVERVKGESRVAVYRHAGDHPELLREDMLVKSGDVLQLRYKPERAKHGVIASIDGAGEVTLHFPATERGSTALAKDATSLPHSYALDDAPKFERFFFVTCDEPIDVVRTLNTLRTFAQRADSATATLELPDELDSWSLRLRKPEQKAPQ